MNIKDINKKRGIGLGKYLGAIVLTLLLTSCGAYAGQVYAWGWNAYGGLDGNIVFV